jgi:hypothetical protein
MGTSFLRGQQLGRSDLNIFLTNSSGHPVNAAEINYAIYDNTTGQEVLVGPQRRIPVNSSIGEYFVSLVVPLDANIGDYRVRWTMREMLGGPLQSVVQEFNIQDREVATPNDFFSGYQIELIKNLRFMLRDANPDRNYKFRPPAHEETIDQFSKVFGYIWESEELAQFIDFALDMVIAAPPRTPFNHVDHLMQQRPEWRTLLLMGAQVHAIGALQANWIADEFDYSIGGVSLNLDKSSKYESLKQGAADQFDKQLERAKATVKYIKGLQQPKYGAGIRSSFGPYVGRGVLAPSKFLGV